jgi:hypothetical protein
LFGKSSRQTNPAPRIQRSTEFRRVQSHPFFGSRRDGKSVADHMKRLRGLRYYALYPE